MENNNELSREEYKKKIQQEREDDRRLNEIKEKIRKNRIQEEKKKKRIIKFAKGFIGVAALSISMFVGIKKLYAYNTVDPDNIEYDEVILDMMIHAHAGEVDPKGHVMGARDPHPCVPPNDGKTYYTVRLRNALEGQYTDRVIDETIDLFDPLMDADSKEEVAEIRDRLNEIEDSLYKNDEGLWDSKICSISNSRSR